MDNIPFAKLEATSV